MNKNLSNSSIMHFIMCIAGACGIKGNDTILSLEDDSEASVLSKDNLPKLQSGGLNMLYFACHTA